jgi:2-keto-3-deoxy-L-rhamnonate aldolase RhmA
MSGTAFRARLRAGDRLLGTLVQIPHPDVALHLARQGFDWLFLDGEHGGYGPAEVVATLRVLDGSVPCLVRVPSLQPDVLGAAAACGAAGLILPHVDAAAQAEAAVRQIRGPGLVVVQAESREAVAHIDAIAQVSGVDAVYVGPYDLTESLGIPGQFGHPAFAEAVDTIVQACQSAHMPLGIFRMTAPEILSHTRQGFTLLATGLDSTLLAAGARGMLAELRWRGPDHSGQ